MEEVTLNGKEYQIPTKWEEVKYSQFLSFSKLIKSFKTEEELREELKDKGETMDLYMSLETLKSNTKMVSFWTGISEDDIAICDLDDVTLVLNKLGFINKQYTPIHIDSFVFNDDKYLLPQVGMAKSTFGDYIQAEQLEINNKELELGRIEVMPEQIAILCKKDGEAQISEDEIDKRAKMFKELDMATIWDVAFFLTQRERLLMTSFLISQKEQMIASPKLQQKEQ